MKDSYGPQGFEKEWIKQLKGFNETKIFFFHDKSQTTVKYIDGNKLLGVEMYRSGYEIDNWLGHFQHYLDTGTFDTNFYWEGHNTIKNAAGEGVDTILTPATAIPMVLKKKLWSEHSPAMNKFMKDERANKDNGMGFRRVRRP